MKQCKGRHPDPIPPRRPDRGENSDREDVGRRRPCRRPEKFPQLHDERQRPRPFHDHQHVEELQDEGRAEGDREPLGQRLFDARAHIPEQQCQQPRDEGDAGVENGVEFRIVLSSGAEQKHAANAKGDQDARDTERSICSAGPAVHIAIFEKGRLESNVSDVSALFAAYAIYTCSNREGSGRAAAARLRRSGR
ncbi:hypothetical protein ACVIQT_004371 [Bradyrhizobium diazoefficiens]